MALLILGIAVFLGTHLVPAFPDLRERLIGNFGLNAYRALFAVLSILGVVLIVYGFARAPFVQIWAPPSWTRHLAMLLMLPVFVLILAAYLPGKIKQTVKHPFLVAIKTWALAHLIANGDLASMILFGSFLAYAVIDRIALKHRPGAEHGMAGVLPASRRNDIVAVVGGLALYVAFLLWLHPLLIGKPLVAAG